MFVRTLDNFLWKPVSICVNKGCRYRIKGITILEEMSTYTRRHTGKRKKVSRLSLTGSDSKLARDVSGTALPLEQRTKGDNRSCVKKLLGVIRGELSYLAPIGSENISAPYFKQCFFRGGWYYPPDSQTPLLTVPRQK